MVTGFSIRVTSRKTVIVDDEAVANSLNGHAGSQNRSKRRATSLQKAENPRICLECKHSPQEAGAWGASLLKLLPQPFKDLAVRWGFAPSVKQLSASTDFCASSPSASGASRRQQASPTEWTHESPAQRPLELQLCLSLTSSSVGTAGQKQSGSKFCSLQVANMGSSGSTDKEGFSRAPAQIAGNTTKP